LAGFTTLLFSLFSPRYLLCHPVYELTRRYCFVGERPFRGMSSTLRYVLAGWKLQPKVAQTMQQHL